MLQENFRVPDKVFWIFALVVNLMTWIMLAYLYSSLPERLPTHFGLNGQPDAFAVKTFWTVFLPAIIQSAETILLAWIYHHPQYSHIPSSMMLALVPAEWRDRLVRVLRHFLVMVTVVMNLIFAYVALTIINTALGTSSGSANSWAIAGLISVLLALITVYTVWMFRLSKQAVEAAQRSA